MAKIIIHGYKESYVFCKDVKIYKGNEYVGAVKHNSLFVVDAEEGDVLIFKVGSKEAAVTIESGVKEVYLKLSRWSGKFSAYKSSGTSVPKEVGKTKNNLIFLACLFGGIGCVVLFGWYHDYNEKQKLKEIYGPSSDTECRPPIFPPVPGEDSVPPVPPERSEKMCMNCNGTGVVPAGYSVASGEFGSRDCYSKAFDSSHVCHIIMCPTCHQSHCETLSLHKECKACHGTGRD